ncbi:hypothetical protein FWP33_18640 [Vibrio parahaemolyticus]|jgi:hypothetical protein|uniref:Uncharacterized protein n=1 Tax=Vibrio jasicida TaxID=766224 RepID=A0AAU9QT42_9VIBR|nr:hypothetical protein [Vibrio parahaemolyticus]ELA8176756.1 hypothetical protein [Vibrio alginolyticus]CAH1598909.1 hypothetical protein THF1C08_50309 [Vibrio jasicida]CAH1601428.1 hypothetical protein THF1A12_50037 [Vibrio jasicida]
METDKPEIYSDALVFAAEMAHRLFVNFTLMDAALDTLRNDANQGLSSSERNYMDYDFEFSQLERFKGTYQLAMDKFFSLLLIESNYPLTIETNIDYLNPYRSISGYPPWIGKLFPYFQDEQATSKIQAQEHYKLKAPDYSDHTATAYEYDTDLVISKSIPLDFIKVWWPIAGGYAENGYIETNRLSDGLLLRFGREF